MGELSPTIYGIETEYSVLLRYPNEVVHEIVGQCHSVDAMLGLYQEPKSAGANLLDDEGMSLALMDMGIIKTESGMLSNGGRLYLDPSGPEYDTPETVTAEEAVHRTYDGDFILKGVLDYLRKVENIEGYQINRRIVDHNRASRGIHLNTTTSLTLEMGEAAVPQIAAINVAKGAMFGSGGLLLDDDGTTHFHHSPRLSLTNAESARSAYYQKRPLVRMPFKNDGSRLMRVETVTSDALNFAWPLRASLVMTNAILKLIEMRRGNSMLVFPDAVEAAQSVGRYGNSFKIDAENRQGNIYRMYPVDILRATCELILSIHDKEGHLDDESKQVLPEIIETADMMKSDETSVATRVESIARKLAIERKMEKSSVDLQSEKICSFDYYWDWSGGGLAQKLREKKLIGWHGFASTKSAKPRAKIVASPPSDSRAKIRGEQILEHGPGNESTWDTIEFGDHSHYVAPDTSEFVCISEDEYPLN